MTMHNKIKTKAAQNLIEYAMVISIVSVAVVAMSTYVFRSVQATQQVIVEEYATD